MRGLLLVLAAILLPIMLHAADGAPLSAENWESYVPAGKETDAILGDLALRSDKVSAVIAQPLPWRKANLSSGVVGACLLDLTLRSDNNDQLTGFYPVARNMPFVADPIETNGGRTVLRLRGKSVVMKEDPAAAKEAAALKEAGVAKEPAPVKDPVVVGREHTLTYELEDGADFILVRSVLKNASEVPWELTLEDSLRADNYDQKQKEAETDFFCVQDVYWRAAYGVAAEGHRVFFKGGDKPYKLLYIPAGAQSPKIVLKPGESYELVRRIFPAAHTAAARGAWLKQQKKEATPVSVKAKDPSGPVEGALITLKTTNGTFSARTPMDGLISADLEPGEVDLKIQSMGRAEISRKIKIEGPPIWGQVLMNSMSAPSRVKAAITDDTGAPIPCKVQFKGLNETKNPNFGPKSAVHAVENLYYSHNGTFEINIDPGEYEAIVSYGPVYDVQRVPLKVGAGETIALNAKLKKSVSTDGWFSADFHSHSSPSGDNTGDQRGRVLNLLCEHIDFAPCTEHQRVDTYVPHLEALGATDRMGTCSGIELTGSPLPLAHLNAFPMKMTPRTQNNGGPVTGPVEEQLKRLTEWDEKTEKLVQQNHPDIGWLFFDKNGDYKPDGGYKEGFKYINVMEVHPIENVLAMKPTYIALTLVRNNRIFNWLQLLNLGQRIPGVVNTDAHYNAHGSGGIFNWVASSAKSPGKIDSMEIVRNSKAGKIVMSNGPFMRVDLNGTLPGGDLALNDGKGTLNVEVQTPNWIEVNRVQVLLNGRPEPSLNFTQEKNPELFKADGVRFKHAIALALEKDTHVIVVAAGDKPLGDVMGPDWGKQKPAAISNPIYVDRDGNGFQPNGDTLGHDLPVKGERPVRD